MVEKPVYAMASSNGSFVRGGGRGGRRQRNRLPDVRATGAYAIVRPPWLGRTGLEWSGIGGWIDVCNSPRVDALFVKHMIADQLSNLVPFFKFFQTNGTIDPICTARGGCWGVTIDAVAVGLNSFNVKFCIRLILVHW